MSARVAKVRALVADEPCSPLDVQGMPSALRRLCGAAVRAIPASGAGLSVMTESGLRGLAAAADARSERIDEFQFSLGEGPCMDAFATRRPVLEPDIGVGGLARWPVYSSAAHDEGVRAAFAFPLQVGAARLGVLDLYRDETGTLSAEELAQALTFADVATTMLLDAQEQAPPGVAGEGLEEAMSYHYEMHQAQGMVMIQLGVSLAESLSLMRAHAFSHERTLAKVAGDVVARRLRLDRDRT